MRLTPPSSPSIASDLRCRLPGGMQGEPYDAVIDVPPGHEVYAAQVPRESGLVVVQQCPVRLQGVLTASAPVTVQIVLRNLATQNLLQTEARLHVVANPKALYADIPADSNAIGAKSDRQCMEARTGRWAMIGASIRGRAHANAGGHREDDVRVRAVGADLLAFAISDGAGSARLAALASAIAVESGIDALEATLATQDAEHALGVAAQEAYRTILRAAEQHRAHIDDFGCTLTLGVYRLPANNAATASLALWQIGDGIVMTQSAEGSRILLAGDHGEYAGQTRFLHHLGQTPAQFQARAKCFEVPGTSWMIACTDGISDPFSLDLVDADGSSSALTDCPPIAAIVRTACAVVNKTATVEQLFDAMAVFTPGDHDDRTLVLITPEEVQ